MLGFGPISGNGMVPGGSGEWFSPFGASSSAFPEKWYLGRYIGERSSVSGTGGRPLYRVEVCYSSNSSLSGSAARITAVGRLVNHSYGAEPNQGVVGRPRYKVDASYHWSATAPFPPHPGTNRTWARLIGSRSSFLSDSSLFSGRALYAGKSHCKGRAPSSVSSSSRRQLSGSNVSLSSGDSLNPVCCPGREPVFPSRLKVTITRYSVSYCAALMGAIDGAIMEWGQRPTRATACNPGGWGWWGSLPGPVGPSGVPFLYCASNGPFGCAFFFGIIAEDGNMPRPSPPFFTNECNPSGVGGGSLGYTWFANAPGSFLPTVCNDIFPLYGSMYYTPGPSNTDCCAGGEWAPNNWDFVIDVD